MAVEDEVFAEEMEDMYLEDLERATEIVLSAKKRILPTGKRPRRHRGAKGRQGSAGRVAAGALGVGNAVGAAITNHRSKRSDFDYVFNLVKELGRKVRDQPSD